MYSENHKMPNDKSYIKLIADILVTNGRRSWIQHGDLRVYMRHGFHRLEKAPCLSTCLDIANVEAQTSGKGNFTLFLTQVEQQVLNCPTCDFIYIESIINKRFIDFFKSRGYAFTINSNMLAPNMFKKFKAIDAI